MDLVLGPPPEPEFAGGQDVDYLRRLSEWLQAVHDYTHQAQDYAGVRQNRPPYPLASVPGDKVWVYCPVRKKGVCPKLCSHCQGPAEVMTQLSEVVYWVSMLGWGCMVVLHHDRLAPYHPLASPAVEEGGASCTPCPNQNDSLPAGLNRPARLRWTPGHLKDFLWVIGLSGAD